MFKSNWEKVNARGHISDQIILDMLKTYCDDVKSTSFLIGGCANINIRVNRHYSNVPMILRVYLRDKESVYREQKISSLLRKKLPIPEFYHVGEYAGFTFSIIEYLPGQTLRDLLLNEQLPDISPYAPAKLRRDKSDIMFKVGRTLGEIAKIKFPSSGFFNKNLDVETEITSEGFVDFCFECLENNKVKATLPQQQREQIKDIFRVYKNLLPNEAESNLVHADFDPANILVTEVNGQLEVSGILDWEFSFAGSTMCDVAGMLRYAHQMPNDYQDSFLKGLRGSGYELPSSWQMTVNLLNIVSLLDCLVRSDSENRPNQIKDIQELIDHILVFLNQSKYNVCASYEKIADWFDGRKDYLYEQAWLDKFLSQLKPTSNILDIGCGMGEPIGKYFIDRNFNVTGIDGCKKFIEMASQRVPKGEFILSDMRELKLTQKFDAIIAWNSLFHLTADDQKNMFKNFVKHLNDGGILMFTTGSEAAEIWSNNGGENLYHASLSPDEYKKLLKEHGFELIDYKIDDKSCNDHTVWLAKWGKKL